MLPGSPIFFRGGGRCAVTAIRHGSDSAGHSNVSVATAIALDAHRLDAAGWFSAAAVAAVFAVAHNDATPSLLKGGPAARFRCNAFRHLGGTETLRPLRQCFVLRG